MLKYYSGPVKSNEVLLDHGAYLVILSKSLSFSSSAPSWYILTNKNVAAESDSALCSTGILILITLEVRIQRNSPTSTMLPHNPEDLRKRCVAIEACLLSNMGDRLFPATIYGSGSTDNSAENLVIWHSSYLTCDSWRWPSLLVSDIIEVVGQKTLIKWKIIKITPLTNGWHNCEDHHFVDCPLFNNKNTAGIQKLCEMHVGFWVHIGYDASAIPLCNTDHGLSVSVYRYLMDRLLLISEEYK
jgi:hypothetical protein